MAIHMEKNKIRSLLYAKSIAGKLTERKSKNRNLSDNNIGKYFYDVCFRKKNFKTKYAKYNGLLF